MTEIEREYYRDYYKKHIERKRKQHRDYYHKNKTKRIEYQRQWLDQNREHHRTVSRDANHRVRIELINFLGGKCCKCGVDDWRVLQVDHTNGDGYLDRKKEREGHCNWSKLKNIKENPTKYQLLCANCNWIKRHENKESVGYLNLYIASGNISANQL